MVFAFPPKYTTLTFYLFNPNIKFILNIILTCGKCFISSVYVFMFGIQQRNRKFSETEANKPKQKKNIVMYTLLNKTDTRNVLSSSCFTICHANSFSRRMEFSSACFGNINCTMIDLLPTNFLTDFLLHSGYFTRFCVCPLKCGNIFALLLKVAPEKFTFTSQEC